MANKTLGTRQKLSFRIEPSQGFAKPRNPLAHGKSGAAMRQAARIALARKLGETDSD